jgi:hypothetical protein
MRPRGNLNKFSIGRAAGEADPATAQELRIAGFPGVVMPEKRRTARRGRRRGQVRPGFGA